MNTDKITGLVSFKMILTQGKDVSETKYETTGILFKKQDNQFLFFEEMTYEAVEPTKCRVEFNSNQMRIRRNGPVIMDQVYKLSENVEGYIKTVYGQLNTEVKTYVLSVENNSNSVELILDYDLYVSNEKAGNYKLTIGFTKEEI